MGIALLVALLGFALLAALLMGARGDSAAALASQTVEDALKPRTT
jgi:hypothetical protein